MRRRILALLILPLIAAGPAFAQGMPDTSHLPDFGSRADTVLTKSRERMLGQSIVHQLRAQGAILEDPLVSEYISLLGSQISSKANDGDFDFNFLVIDDDVVNAFAMPGGVVGVNAGLLLKTENENELAGVIAHEVSHVTQRHIARSMAEARRTNILSMAAVFAAAILGGSSGSSADTTMGLATAAQAAAAQSQINFTRAHEYEADRIGMGVLADAGFDPTGMASFFEKLGRSESVYSSQIPEMLRTHPMSSGRVTEARNRARQLPRNTREDSIGYLLAKARIRVLSSRSPQDALDYFEPRQGSDDPGDRYGLALSFLGIGLNDTAGRIFAELSREYPSVIAFRIGEAEALLADGLDRQAVAVYQEAIALSPRNIPLVVSYGEALLTAGRPAEAHAVLLDLLNNVERATPAQIELLARAANAEGDRVNALHYMSEFYSSVGNLPLAIAQLQQALALPELNSVQRARFNVRIDEWREFIAESER